MTMTTVMINTILNPMNMKKIPPPSDDPGERVIWGPLSRRVHRPGVPRNVYQKILIIITIYIKSTQKKVLEICLIRKFVSTIPQFNSVPVFRKKLFFFNLFHYLEKYFFSSEALYIFWRISFPHSGFSGKIKGKWEDSFRCWFSQLVGPLTASAISCLFVIFFYFKVIHRGFCSILSTQFWKDWASQIQATRW